MGDYFQRRRDIRRSAPAATAFVVGERVRVVKAPASYGYNGRAGIIVEIAGAQISVLVDEHPLDTHCTTFYAEELEREGSL